MQNSDKIFTYLNKFQCAFITAFRQRATETEIRIINKKIAEDVKASGLSYLKLYRVEKEGVNDIDKDCYMLINNNIYLHDDFKALAIKWCMKYGLPGALITEPPKESGVNTVTGAEYGKNGVLIKKFDSISRSDIEAFFSSAQGEKISLIEGELHMTATGYNLHSRQGVASAYYNFEKKYPVFRIQGLKLNYKRPPVYYKLVQTECTPLDFVRNEADKSRDYEASFVYNGKRYFAEDFAPYHPFKKDISNYSDVFDDEDYPLILNSEGLEDKNRPIIIKIDNDYVNVFEEVEVLLKQ